MGALGLLLLGYALLALRSSHARLHTQPRQMRLPGSATAAGWWPTSRPRSQRQTLRAASYS